MTYYHSVRNRDSGFKRSASIRIWTQLAQKRYSDIFDLPRHSVLEGFAFAAHLLISATERYERDNDGDARILLAIALSGARVTRFKGQSHLVFH